MSPITRPSPSPQFTRLAAFATVVCVMAAACGSDPAAVDSPPVDSPTVELAPAGPADPPSARVEGPEYGDSLDDLSDSGSPESADNKVVDDAPPGYTTVEWDDLVAPGFGVEDIWARYEDRVAEVVDGTPEANALYDEMRAEYETVASANAELDGAQIQLAGFVTPLSYEGVGISEFLLVPYFGACIHTPPPPPNQVVLVNLDVGMNIMDSYGPVWVTGTLDVATSETELATASYTLTGGTSRVYDY